MKHELSHVDDGVDVTFDEYFVIIDMDRTLLATDHLGVYLYHLFHMTGVEQDEIATFLDRYVGDGVDTLTLLLKRFGDRLADSTHRELSSGQPAYDEVAEDLLEGYDLEVVRSDLLLPGARELCALFDQQSIPYAVLTTGGEVFQQLKLALLRRLLDVPRLSAMVVSQSTIPDKTAYLSHALWDGEMGSFRIPPEMSGGERSHYARKVVILDDKHENLATSHQNIYAYHIGTYTLEGIVDYLEVGSLDDLIKARADIDK